MDLGSFSVSLAVKDLAASRAFYAKLGFEQFGGDPEQNWLIMRNKDHVIGLFQGMFEKNMLTFNPGWDQNARELQTFDDIREIQRALKASGVSIYHFFPPVALFCTVGSLLTMYLTIFGIPWGTSSLKALTSRVAASSFEIGLKERTFNDTFKDVMLYVNKIDIGTKELIDIFIEDNRSKDMVSTIISPKGKLFSDEENMVFRMRLWNGVINQVNIKTKSVNSIQFDTYDVRLDIKEIMRGNEKRGKSRMEMSLAEMRAFMDNSKEKNRAYYKTQMDYHKKFSVPLAGIILGLLAVPLGFQVTVRKRSSGLILGLTFFLIYYILLTAGWGFGESGKYPPFIGMWAPNVIMGVLAVIFTIRAGRDRPLLFGPMPAFVYRIINRLFKRK